MALIRNGTVDAKEAARFTEELASELLHPKPEGQPLIYENRIGQSPRYSITIIWDKWNKLSQQGRSRVILDAYESAAPQRTGQIAIALGLTTLDAASMGILPYAVIPAIQRAEGSMREQIIRALKNEGATETSDGIHLRYRTLEEAEAAYTRLQKALPGPHWVVTQELQHR